ncbi:hypothetical protein [Streptomyces sp. t39]|uniref:hypothetical protein n=1 Tax=Streptomyces sp. t39 TaxID=1828156 RepID=UPI0021C97C51|nr:hypothetical protein [Streptomyces sp. t39]
MPPDDLDTTAAKLRQQLADQLATGDWLRSPEWRAAVENVPRHEFLRRFYTENLGPGVTSWTPINAELVGLREWLTIATATRRSSRSSTSAPSPRATTSP